MKSLHLAGAEDAERLLPMVAAYHSERGFDLDEERRAEAVKPLLEGSPHGAVWLIGPRKAPVGYIVVTFGWSLEFGGLDAIVDELYVRPAVRGRGMGSDALDGIARALRDGGVQAIHLEAARHDARARAFYERSRFRMREGYALMSRRLV
ncbi:GNAT family N-acetyltransferase [Roseivivax sp. CAU 1761]